MARNKLLLAVSKKPKRQKLRSVILWVLYSILILMAFVLGTAGDYVKPLLLLPIALCISSVCSTAVAGGIGIACGLLIDISYGTLLGYHAIPLFLICMGVSLLYDRLMQQRLLNLVFFTLVAAFLITGSDYIFQYAIWGYENVSQIYVKNSLPCLVYTVISSVVYYPIFRLMHRFLLPPRRRKVERTVKPIDD